MSVVPVDPSPVALIVSDPAGVVTAWNAGAIELFGHEAQHAIGRTVDSLLVPDELRDAHASAFERFRVSGSMTRGSEPFVVPALHADGSRVAVELTVLPLAGVDGFGDRNADEDQCSVLCVARPSVRGSAARTPEDTAIQILFDRAPEAITIIDGLQRQRTVNHAGSILVGYGPGRHGGDGTVLLHPDDRDRVEQNFAGIVAGRISPAAPIRYRVLRGDGRWAWLESVAADLTDVPEVAGYVVFSRDVSDDEEHREALDAARRIAADAAARDQARAARRLELTAAVSHELRTPLTSLSSAAEAILTDAPLQAAEREEYLGIIRRSAGRLIRLIEDVVLLAQMEADVALRIHDVDPTQLVRNVVDGVTAAASRRGVRFHLHLDHGVDGDERLEADGERMRQAVENVLGNAVKYSLPNTVIDVTSSWVDDVDDVDAARWTLTVVNRCRPFADGDVSRLTTPFVRAASAREAPGTGLGLAVVESIAERHGGDLRISLRAHDAIAVQLRFPRRRAGGHQG